MKWCQFYNGFCCGLMALNVTNVLHYLHLVPDKTLQFVAYCSYPPSLYFFCCHDYNAGIFLIYHPPEVRYRVRKTTLSWNVNFTLPQSSSKFFHIRLRVIDVCTKFNQIHYLMCKITTHKNTIDQEISTLCINFKHFTQHHKVTYSSNCYLYVIRIDIIGTWNWCVHIF